jgi:cell fate regulator YaaT (PSP1 superfamily)
MPQVRIVGVRFRRAGRVFYFDPGELELRIDDRVVAETDEGPQVGRVVISPDQVMESGFRESLAPLLRQATEDDVRELGDQSTESSPT